MDAVIAQVVRALRAHRSQVQLSRRLGFTSNPVAEWEGQRRAPQAVQLLQVAEVCGVDVAGVLSAFHAPSARSFTLDDAGMARWLDALRGGTPVSELARRSGVSRTALGKWLRGDTRPRAPDAFRVVEAATGRLAELVALLVDIEAVPCMELAWNRQQRARTLLVERPWSAAVLTLIDVDEAGEHAHSVAHLARRLGIGEDEVRQSVQGLLEAGALVRVGARYRPASAALTVDTPEGLRSLKRHWAEVGRDRVGAREDSRYAHNVFSVSRSDLQRIRELQGAFYRQVRAIVAESEPTEVVALLNLQLLTLADPADGDIG